MRAHKNCKLAEERLMEEKCMEYFIPKKYAIRTYHGIKSKRLVPIIPDIIFVRANKSQILDFKNKCSILQFVTWKKSTGTEYITVPDEQMDNFIKVVSQYDEDLVYFNPEEINLKKGTHIMIHGGKFDKVKGTFLKVKGKRNRRIVVLLDGIIAVAAEVSPDLIEVLS